MILMVSLCTLIMIMQLPLIGKNFFTLIIPNHNGNKTRATWLKSIGIL